MENHWKRQCQPLSNSELQIMLMALERRRDELELKIEEMKLWMSEFKA